MKRSNNSSYVGHRNGEPTRHAGHPPEAPLIVDRTADGHYVVHAITPEAVIPLGIHEGVADAWAAIDAFDCLDSPAEEFARAA